MWLHLIRLLLPALQEIMLKVNVRIVVAKDFGGTVACGPLAHLVQTRARVVLSSLTQYSLSDRH